MLSLLDEQQNSHFNALLGTRLTIGIEKLQKVAICICPFGQRSD